MTAQATVRRRTSKTASQHPWAVGSTPVEAPQGLGFHQSSCWCWRSWRLWSVYFSTALVTKRVSVVGTHDLTPMQVSFAAQVLSACHWLVRIWTRLPSARPLCRPSSPRRHTRLAEHNQDYRRRA